MNIIKDFYYLFKKDVLAVVLVFIAIMFCLVFWFALSIMDAQYVHHAAQITPRPYVVMLPYRLVGSH